MTVSMEVVPRQTGQRVKGAGKGGADLGNKAIIIFIVETSNDKMRYQWPGDRRYSL